MKTALKILGLLLVVLVLLAGGGYGWAARARTAKLSRTIDTHRVDFPVPFPLDPSEAAGLSPEEAAAAAVERAAERGRHLVESRYVCVECHGQDFSGGVMVDDPMLGTLLGPNLTLGSGSRTTGFTPADWDRIVRHGVRSDGRPAAMPSEDFRRMSDQELSDIITYIRQQPPVDNTVPPIALGPLGTVLLATGQLPLSADLIGEHFADHAVLPPAAEASAEYGEHLAGVCAGCHGLTFAGGPVPGGDPSWPPSANLTPHADGLADWTYEQFRTALREGTRPDGTELAYPMSMVVSYTGNMTDVEMEALWAYLRTVEPEPTPR